MSTGGNQLEEALGALGQGEKYNAVLLSLLSKGGGGEEGDAGMRASALKLVEEMSGKRLSMNSEALKMLIDTAVDEGTTAS